MTDHTDEWTEFEWEQSLRENDEYASRYFDLLRRFCDLPGGNELIAQHMGPEFEELVPDCEYDCEACEHRWDCDFATPPDWNAEDCNDCPDREECQPSWEPHGNADEDFEAEAAEDGAQPYFYETDPTFRNLRHAAIGWCNIYAAILPQESRPVGLKVLFHIGRALANLAYSIEDGSYPRLQASISFGKRALGQLNLAIGLINQMMNETTRLRRLLETIRTHLMQSRQSLIDHIQSCRREAATGRD